MVKTRRKLEIGDNDRPMQQQFSYGFSGVDSVLGVEAASCIQLLSRIGDFRIGA